MKPRTPWHALLGLAAAVFLAGCDLTLTQEPVRYEDLPPAQQAAVDRILARVAAFNGSVVGTGYADLGPVAHDRERVDVALDGIWVIANLGDGRLHLSAWDRLSAGQKQRWASWFGETVDLAAARYLLFFYEYVAVHLAGIQAVYAIQGVEWVYGHRSVFNVERDAERLAVTYLVAVDPGLLAWAEANCAVLLSRFASEWGTKYDQVSYGDNFREITDPDDPSGYLYYLCRHEAAAQQRRLTYSTDFRAELEMIQIRRNMADEGE
jgi:hypothetical protein